MLGAGTSHCRATSESVEQVGNEFATTANPEHCRSPDLRTRTVLPCRVRSASSAPRLASQPVGYDGSAATRISTRLYATSAVAVWVLVATAAHVAGRTSSALSPASASAANEQQPVSDDLTALRSITLIHSQVMSQPPTVITQLLS